MNYIDQYKIALDLLEKECDRFWTRNNVFLLIQAALVAFYTNIKDDLFYKNILALEGSILAILWACVLIKGASYVNRWDMVVRKIEEEILNSRSEESRNFMPLKKLNDSIKGFENRNKIPSFLNKRTTILIRYVIYSLIAFWILVFVMNLLKSQFNLDCIIIYPKINFSWTTQILNI